MTLAAGTRLGPYEILSRLGWGGMGEVYRARDTRLGREVPVHLSEAIAAILHEEPEPSTRRPREGGDGSHVNDSPIAISRDGRSYAYSYIRAVESDLYILEEVK